MGAKLAEIFISTICINFGLRSIMYKTKIIRRISVPFSVSKHFVLCHVSKKKSCLFSVAFVAQKIPKQGSKMIQTLCDKMINDLVQCIIGQVNNGQKYTVLWNEKLPSSNPIIFFPSCFYLIKNICAHFSDDQ